MNNPMTFKTRAAARDYIRTMRGWDARPVQIFNEYDQNKNRNGYVWVIECQYKGKGNSCILEQDGFVRLWQ